VQDGDKGIDVEEAKDAFDPVIIGPWMDLWDLETDVRADPADEAKPLPNQHIERYLETPEDTRDVAEYQKAGNW